MPPPPHPHPLVYIFVGAPLHRKIVRVERPTLSTGGGWTSRPLRRISFPPSLPYVSPLSRDGPRENSGGSTGLYVWDRNRRRRVNGVVSRNPGSRTIVLRRSCYCDNRAFPTHSKNAAVLFRDRDEDGPAFCNRLMSVNCGSRDDNAISLRASLHFLFFSLSFSFSLLSSRRLSMGTARHPYTRA